MTMTGEEKRVGNYAVETFIGYGASSVVFQGYDLKCKAHGVSKNVAIKFIWDREMALDEVRRLEQTQSVFEICDLITYDEISGREIKALIGDTILQIEKAMNCPLPIEDDQLVGMLILKLLNGEHLIDRAIHQGEVVDSNHEWLLTFEHPEIGQEIVLREWLTPVARDLALEDRLEILLQLAKALDESHRQGVVHGDLNPWNVFYEPETGRISIIDLGRNNFGVQGWRTPEHWRLMAEEIENLPSETDVWLLGQWMRYLLPKKGPWAPVIEACQHKDPKKRPTARELVKTIKVFLQPKPQKRLLAVALSFSFALIAGIYAWQQRTPFTLKSEGMSRIAVIPHEGSTTSRLVAEMISKSLETTADLTPIHFGRSREIAQSMGIDADSDIETLLHAGEAVGAHFVLTGAVEDADNGVLRWHGNLIQRGGLVRRLDVTGKNFLVLADQIAAGCLKLLGSSSIPLSISEFYSSDLNANFLYSYGNEFFYEGNFNAAASMYQKALQFDPEFIWAKAKMAFCSVKRGSFREGEEVLRNLIDTPELTLNKQLLISCYGYLAFIARYFGEHELAGEYLEEAKTLNVSPRLRENTAVLHTLTGVIYADMGQLEAARESLKKAEDLYLETDNRFGLIQHLVFEIGLAENRGDHHAVAEKIEQAKELAKRYGIESFEAQLLQKEVRQVLFLHASEISEDTLEKLERARAIQDRLGEENHKLITDYYIAFYYSKMDELKKAEAIAADVYRKSKKLGDFSIEEKVAILMADLAQRTGRVEEAEFYLTGLLDQERKPALSIQQLIFSRLCGIYAEQLQFQKALEAGETYLELCQRTQNKKFISYAFNNLGELMEKQQNYESAWDYYRKSMALKRETKDKRGIIWTLRNMVMVSLKQEKMADANRLMAELLEMDATDFQTQVVLARVQYANKNYDQAYRTLSNCKTTAMEKGRWNERLEIPLQTYSKAFHENRYLPLPEQFGNRF